LAVSTLRSATISRIRTCRLRLAAAGHKARWLPDAQVHHAFAASTRRTADRVPLSLFDIGASTAVFLRKHAPSEMDDALLRLAEDQRARLFRLVRRRKLGARDLEALMRSLRDGIDGWAWRAHSENSIPRDMMISPP
jgi:hypothetical protein